MAAKFSRFHHKVSIFSAKKSVCHIPTRILMKHRRPYFAPGQVFMSSFSAQVLSFFCFCFGSAFPISKSVGGVRQAVCSAKREETWNLLLFSEGVTTG